MHNWTHDIAAAFARAGHDADLDIVEELAQHAEAAYAAARAEGASEADAEADVRRQIGVWTREAPALKRRHHRLAVPPPPATSTKGTAGVMQDVRYAVRMLRRQWPFALLVIGTMAAGITATTLLFSVIYGVLLKPLPWPDADRLVRLEERREGATRTMPGIMTNGPYLAWSESPSTVEGLAAYRAQTVTVTGAGDSERIRVTSTTASLFPLLRASPERGTIFTAADEAAHVTVISHGLWVRRFGAREDVVGRTIGFDGVSHTIVGIMPRDFVYPDRETAAWVPSRIRPTTTPDGGSWIQIFSAIARLAPGVTPAQAADEATARARAIDGGMAAIAVFGTKGRAQITVTPVLDALTGGVREALGVLLVAVTLLLATATANIASVQLARASTRRKEMAVRAAIGAGTGRLARQVIVETLVVGAAGGVLGWIMAVGLHATLPALLPAGFPRVDDIRLEWRVSVFALAVAVLASLAAGLAPALQARRLNLVEDLVEQTAASGRAAGRSRVARIRALIMTGQVAVACVLLAGASLLTRTFVAMLRADRGYVASNVLTAQLATPGGLFTANQRAQLVTRTLEHLRARDSVAAAGIATSVPLLPADAVMAFTMPPAFGRDQPVQVQCSYRMISPGYLEAMGIMVVEGRALNDRDNSTSTPVLLVNRAFANRYLGPNAVGRSIPAGLREGKRDWEIAGIIDDVKMGADLLEAAQPEILVSYLQFADGLESDPVFVVRTRRDPAAMIETLRHMVRQQASTATLESVMTMEDRIVSSLAQPRLYAVLLSAFGAFALLIAGVGLFGVLSYNVAQRARELGIRSALGATPAAIVRLVLAEGLVISAIGACAGLGASLAAARWLSAFLYGVEPFDPATLVIVPAALLLVAAAASVAPAVRAARTDPLRVLKGGN